MPFNKLNKILARTLFLLPIQLIITLQPSPIDAYNLNETRSSYALANTTLKTHIYPNHRMDADSVVAGNLTLRLMDREASGSVLRPQVAVQIYTSPSSSNQDVSKNLLHTPSRSHHGGAMSAHKDDLRHQQQRLASSTDGFRSSGEGREASKLNNWHYITDQQSSPSNQGADVDNSVAESYSLSSGPLINAIITVPNPSEQHHHHHHSQPSQLNYPSISEHHDDVGQHGASAGNVDASLMRLMDNQSSSNIEFSMNLNGDEIIINPTTNKGLIASPSNSKEVATEEYVEDRREEGMVPRHYVSRTREVPLERPTASKSLRKLESERGDDQPAASEINLIDGADDGDRDIDIDGEQSRVKDSVVTRTPTRARSLDSESGEDKEERVGGNRSYWSDGSNSKTTDPSATTDEYGDERSAADESSLDRSPSSRYDQEDKKASVRSQSIKSKSAPNGRRLYGPSGKKVASSKRKVSYKSDDGDTVSFDDQVAGKRESKGDADQEPVSSVMIKGEDVRKFERLLENLRSLSLKNLDSAKSRRLAKTTRVSAPKQSEQSDDDDGFDRSDDSPSGQDGSSRVPDFKTGSHHSDRRNQGRLAQAESEASGGDCGRRRQQQLQRAASGEESSPSAYEPESSVNVGEQDTAPSGDGTEELNDDGGQTASSSEQDEQSSNNHNKISFPPADHAQEADVSPQEVSVTRKTVMQNFYNDDNANQAPSSRASSPSQNGDSHRSGHETQHERVLASQPYQQQQQVLTGSHRRASSANKSHRPVSPSNGGSTTTQTSYIDYNQLDDREIYKGSESKKVKFVVLPRKHSLQRIIERASLKSLNTKLS